MISLSAIGFRKKFLWKFARLTLDSFSAIVPVAETHGEEEPLQKTNHHFSRSLH